VGIEQAFIGIEELRKKITEANVAYRKGHPIIPDAEYDSLVDELTALNPHDHLLSQIGFNPENDERKEKLPIEMASLNKVKTTEEIRKWIVDNQLQGERFILTPKYDGCSIVADEAKKKAWTRGDGLVGQRSDAHYKKMTGLSDAAVKGKTFITIGEAMCSKSTFDKKFSGDFANSRNMMAGALNRKTADDMLVSCEYIRYGLIDEDLDKEKQLEVLNKLNRVKVPFKNVGSSFFDNATADLKDLFVEWSKDWTLDGIVIEVNRYEKRQEMGRESNSNPAYARAYKGSFEEVKETEVVGIEWNVSKQGYLKPVGLVKPVSLDGATVSRVSLYNAANILNLQIGKGAIITMRRSGQVIPEVVHVVKKATVMVGLPVACPICNSRTDMNENQVELICTNPECKGKALKRLISFFETLEVDNAGEGTMTALYDAGYTTVAKVLKAKKEDLRKLPSFGDSKAKLVYDGIHNKMKDVDLPTLQHASGFFGMLGSKKLRLVEDLTKEYLETGNYDMNKLMATEGYAEKSIGDYMNGIYKFREFMMDLPGVTLKKEAVKVSDNFKGMIVVFTGFRNKEWEEKIQSNGGMVGGSVSKVTTHLVMKVKGSGSSKETKATALGVKIMDKAEFETLMNEQEEQ